MSLKVYNRKRKFSETPEPRGKKVSRGSKGPLRFVVQMHSATRLHWDLRLEFGGVFRSWAVPKGPSLNPLDQRLAVFVEDHPIEYGSFEGIIPKGNYGAGTVMVWDRGTYVERGSKGRADSEAAMQKAFDKGHITFVVSGEKLNGEFALIKLKKDGGGKAWLLVKKRDEHSTYKRSEMPNDLSVKTGRSIKEIASEAEGDGDIWNPAEKRRNKSEKMLSKSKSAKSNLKISKSKAKMTSLPKTSLRIVKESSIAQASQKIVKPTRQVGKDPIPRRVKPMLAVAHRDFKPNSNWLFEADPMGLRAIAEVEGKRVHLYSKSFLSFDKKFPAIAEELRILNGHMILDGEIVTLRGQSTYYVYDILYINGQDLRDSPLRERKQILKTAFKDGKSVRHVAGIESNSSKATRHTNRKDREKAVIAKNLESHYHSGTNSNWLRITEHDQSTSEAAPAVTAESSSPSKLKLSTLTTRTQGASVEEVSESSHKSTNLSTSARIRAANSAIAAREEVRLTNLDKVFWPEEKYTKGDLLNYYKEISSYILPYLKDRPESLNRQPNGIAKPGFYQKDMTGHIPRWLKTTRIFSESADKSIDYVLVQDERSLLYIVNLGCIEINPWFARVPKLDNPDFMVIDLDPDGNKFEHVIEVAHEVRKTLEAVGGESFCKTSGATGIHIGVPTGARYDFDQVRIFAEAVCKVVNKKFPATTSLDRNPNRRQKKIYLDFMQNRRGQTLAAPFCVRPRPKATVSMPVSWKELTPRLKPEDFTIENAAERIRKFKDPWKGIFGDSINLERCMRELRRKFSPA